MPAVSMRGPGTSPLCTRRRRATGILSVRAGIHHRRKARMSEHLAHLARQFLRWLIRRVIPLRFHEMHMRIPETGKHKQPWQEIVSTPLGIRGMLSDFRDHSMTDQNRHAPPRRCIWRRVDSGSRNRQVLCSNHRIQAEQEQCENTSPDIQASDH